MARKQQIIKKYLFYNLIFILICFIFSLVIHLLALLNLKQVPSFMVKIIYAACVYGFIVLSINQYIDYINMPYFKKVLRCLLPENKFMLWDFFLVYLIIIAISVKANRLFVMDNIKQGILFHTAIQLLVESFILSNLYWNYRTINYIENNDGINPELIMEKNNLIYKDNGIIIYRRKYYVDLIEIIFYLIIILSFFTIHLHKVYFLVDALNKIIDLIRNYPYIYILTPLFLKGFKKTIRNILGYEIKFDTSKGLIYYGKKVIDFKDVAFVQIRKIEDANNISHEYILSFILKGNRYYVIDMSFSYLRLKELAKNMSDLINVSIREV